MSTPSRLARETTGACLAATGLAGILGCAFWLHPLAGLAVLSVLLLAAGLHLGRG